MHSSMKVISAALCLSCFSVPALAIDVQDIIDRNKQITQNPEMFVTAEEAEKRLAPGDRERFQAAAQEIMDSTKVRVDREIQRVSYDGEAQMFQRDANAEITDGAGLGKNMKAKPALGASGEIRYVVYLSFGMPDNEFDQAMKAIKLRDDTFGVIVGLAEKDHSIPDTMKLIYKRWIEANPDTEVPASVYLDPTLFDDHAVESVPTIIRFDGEDPTLTVKGMLNIDWVEDKYEAGARNKLAQQGPVYEIAEENFMDTIKRRMENIDAEKMKREAVDRFWGNQDFAKLPVAEETASYMVDLSFTVSESLQLPSGEYLARKGDRINPLDMLPFQRIGIVFDGSDPAQVAWANEEVKRAMNKDALPILMTTDLDISEDGWEAFRQLNNAIPGYPVKMAVGPVIQRFQVEKVPSRFEQDGKMIRVTEFGKEEY